MSASASGSEGLGLALFLRHGMVAWIEAWSKYTNAGADCAHHQQAVEEILPLSVRSQMATLLAGMILSLQ